MRSRPVMQQLIRELTLAQGWGQAGRHSAMGDRCCRHCGERWPILHCPACSIPPMAKYCIGSERMACSLVGQHVS